MDDVILIIQIAAFIIITGIMILNVPLDADKIEKDDKNEIISFLTLVKKCLSDEYLTELGIKDFLNDEYKSKIPKKYQDYITFYNEVTFVDYKEQEPVLKASISLFLSNLLILIVIIVVVNLMAIIPIISVFVMFTVLLLPYAIFDNLKEKKGKIAWYIFIHPNERTTSIFLQFFAIFFFLSLLVTPIIFFRDEETPSPFEILLFLSVYPIIMCLYLFFYKMYYQYKWKKQWNRIFSLIAKKTIDDQDIFNYTIAKDYKNKIDNYSVFPLGDKAKIYFVTMGLIQTTIYIFYKIVELAKPYLHLI